MSITTVPEFNSQEKRNITTDISYVLYVVYGDTNHTDWYTAHKTCLHNLHTPRKTCRFSLPLTSGSKVVGAKVRALASNHCGLGSNPGGGAKCDLSFLLVFALPSRGFLLVTCYVSQHFHIPVPSEMVSGKL